MRLEPYEIKAIQDSFINNFHSGKIYLFGSRVDDSKKGGDIDLYIEPIETQKLANKKIDFLVDLKSKIGDQKIDVVINRGKNELIDLIAKQQGVLLWKS
ncbi:MAG: nucleotidyltransferase domain-containing protein [Sulfurovaceae bacterium]|nr:nucleotidyltransferase domain-containing protein [Sulfurovaceae bacterium]